MTSGFFLVNKKDVDYSKVVLIIFDVVFFTDLIAVVTWVSGIAEITVKKLIYSGLYWYIVFYLIFYFFVPYINILLRSLGKDRYIRLLVLMFFFWSVIPTLTFQKITFSNLDFFIVMYTAGAFIRLHIHEKIRYRNVWNLVFALGAAAFMILSVIAFDILGVVTKKDFFVANACYFYLFNSIPAVVCALFLFLFFLNLSFHSDVINYAAGSTLHILIIHLNEFLREWIWEGVYPNTQYINRPYLHEPVKVICVYIGCLAVSAVYRQTVRKPVEKAVVRRWGAA